MTISILTGPAAVLFAFSSPGPVCHDVRGDIDARAERLGVDLRGFKVSGGGSIRGGVQGDLHLEVRREGRTGADTEISIRVVADTPSGPVVMQGRALAAREHAGDPLHRVRGWLDVSDQGGAPGSRGRVRVDGTADTSGRRVEIRYEGELCAAPIRSASAGGAPVTALILGALSGGLVSAIVPFVNAELLLVGMTLTTTPSHWPLLVLAIATGQMVGKALLFQTGGRLARTTLGPRLERWWPVSGAPRRTVPLIAASAAVGLPPFYLLAVAAPSMGVRFRTFAVVGLAGRIVRFAAVLLVPAALGALTH